MTTSDAELALLHENPNQPLEVTAVVLLDGQRYEEVELELHGGVGRGWPKKSYRVRFAGQRPERDFFGDGPAKVERLVLQASWIDPTFLRNKLIFDSLRELGALAPRVGHARVYINGQLQGLYQVIERVDEHFLKRHGLSRHGNLYKAENNLGSWTDVSSPLTGFSERTNEDGLADDLADLFHAVSATELTFVAYQREIASRLTISDFMLWQVVMSHALNADAFGKNYYLYHDPEAVNPNAGERFRIIAWDADATYGLTWSGARDPEPARVDLYTDANALAPKLFSIREYREQYLALYRAAMRGPLASDALLARIEQLSSELAEPIAAELQLWPRDIGYEEARSLLEETIQLRSESLRPIIGLEQD